MSGTTAFDRKLTELGYTFQSEIKSSGVRIYYYGNNKIITHCYNGLILYQVPDLSVIGKLPNLSSIPKSWIKYQGITVGKELLEFFTNRTPLIIEDDKAD